MLFGKKQKQQIIYDKTGKQAILKCSICNGEQVAGFKDMTTGKFEEIMFIKSEKDLDEFKALYGVEEITKEY